MPATTKYNGHLTFQYVIDQWGMDSSYANYFLDLLVALFSFNCVPLKGRLNRRTRVRLQGIRCSLVYQQPSSLHNFLAVPAFFCSLIPNLDKIPNFCIF